MSANQVATQIGLFEIGGYQTPEEIAKQQRKRGNYKKRTKTHILNLYIEMKNLYELLASYLPIPLFSREERVFTYKNIRAWYSVYDEDKEDVFTVFEAEIIGSEDMYIDDRLKLHRTLIEWLKSGVSLDEAISRIGGK